MIDHFKLSTAIILTLFKKLDITELTITSDQIEKLTSSDSLTVNSVYNESELLHTLQIKITEK